MGKPKIFDNWPDQYDRWFKTPIGQLVKRYETELINEMLRPIPGETILDAGCGTGVFTMDLLVAGSIVTGLELSLPMLLRAGEKMRGYPFSMVQGDMQDLPFTYDQFDKTVSLTAIEFIKDAKKAIRELFRVTKPGGCVVVATLNSLSPWAVRRKASGSQGHPIFKDIYFRSPKEMKTLLSIEPVVKTAIHFQKHDDPVLSIKTEERGRAEARDTGAFLVALWVKPF